MSSNLQWDMLPGVKKTLAQRTRHSEYWRARNVEPAPEGAFRYLALGDSVAIGVGLDNVLEGYVPQLAERIAAKLGRAAHIVNIAESGHTLTDVIRLQLPKVEQHTPADLVTCVAGANDIAWVQHFDVEQFRTTATELASKLPVGTVMGLIPSFLAPPFEQRVRAANAVLAEVAVAHGHIAADIFTATREQTLIERVRNMSADGFHPNATGYRRWTDALWKVVEPRLDASPRL